VPAYRLSHLGAIVTNRKARIADVAARVLKRGLFRTLSVVVLGLGGIVGIPATAGTALAATPTINCDTVGKPSAEWTSCQQLVGTASCAWNNGNGSWTIALGYNNPSSSILTAAIPVNGVGGTNNALTATSGYAGDPNHISSFGLGTSVTAFTVTWSPTSSTDPVTWNLMGHVFTFNQTTQPKCSAKPVPIMGNMTAVALGLFLLLAAFAIVSRRRAAKVALSPWLGKA
jgi:hypothetical protein